MNNTILTILRKELKRFFGDKRIVFTTIILPGLMIFLMYSFMGDAMTEQYTVKDDYKSKIVIQNMPQSLESVFKEADIDLQKPEGDGEPDGISSKDREKLTEEKLDLFVIFPVDFDKVVTAYDIASGDVAPNVKIYYNSTATKSQAAYEMVTGALNAYEVSMSNKFDVNGDWESKNYDVATEKDTAGKMFSTMLPMLLMAFLFSGCVAIGPEAIAGEKERGTIATMLITPAKREHIALGKILALSLVALLSGVSSTLGTMISLPKLMPEEKIQTDVYGVMDYVCLAVVILSTVLVIVTLISIISAFAKTTKEAQTYVSPLLIIVMLVGVTAMFGNGAKPESGYYIIPLYNSVQCMVGIFSFKMVLSNILLTIISNIVYTGLGVFLLVKMFNSEKVMFNR